MHDTATWSNRISQMLRSRYRVGGDNLALASHPAMMLISANIVARGVMLAPYEVVLNTNERTDLTGSIKQMAFGSVVLSIPGSGWEFGHSRCCGFGFD